MSESPGRERVGQSGWVAECLVKNIKMQLPRPHLRLKEGLFPLWDGARLSIFPRYTRGGKPLLWKNQVLPLASYCLLSTALYSFQGTAVLVVFLREGYGRTEETEKKWLVKATEPQLLVLGPIHFLSCCSISAWDRVRHSGCEEPWHQPCTHCLASKGT